LNKKLKQRDSGWRTKITPVLPEKNLHSISRDILKFSRYFRNIYLFLPFLRGPLTMFCGALVGKHWLRLWFEHLEDRYRWEIPVSCHWNCIIGVRLWLWRHRPRYLLSARRDVRLCCGLRTLSVGSLSVMKPACVFRCGDEYNVYYKTLQISVQYYTLVCKLL